MDNDVVIEIGKTAAESTRSINSRRKKVKCVVVSYNKYSGVIVYRKPDGQLVQTNAIKYDGSGYVTI